MEKETKHHKYTYLYRYCNSQQLCKVHGISYSTLERWNREAKDEGKHIPGKIMIPGVRSYIWDPSIFHDQFLIPKINGAVRNQYEQREHLLIVNNLKQKGIN
tara:strand:- start:196 stop:501 length:306 start_codon:yes stop_codon:yes gene_type:complete